jgi:hypothetical protein
LASYLAGLRITKRNISASILADVKRFFHQINTDEVFGTHNEADSRRQSTQCLPAELQEPDLAGRVHSRPSQRVSAIDVVHKDFFDDWVKRHVEVYAQKFATVALRHQTEIATGSGYVAGMGVNSWTGEKRPDGVMPLDASSCSKAAAGLSLKASNSGFGPRVQRTFDIKYFVPLEPFRYRRNP